MLKLRVKNGSQNVLQPVDRVRLLQSLQSVPLSPSDPPTFSKCVQFSDDFSIWLHVLIASVSIIVATQAPNIVHVRARQSDF